MIEHFWDGHSNDFFFTPDDNEKLIVRSKNHYDLAIPSGNSVAASNLIKLYYYTQDQDLLTKADQMIRRISTPASGNPFGFGQMLSAIYLRLKSPVEVSIIKRGENSVLASYLNRKFLPHGITAILNDADISELEKYPFFKNKSNNAKQNEFAYVCKDFTCSLPIDTVDDLEKNLSVK